ncbi:MULTISPECIES: hypothetical protein [unclassified Agromyces]|uniref:hypothetical protein n=1 Tax=unclassified Agromyces TaxID=2639701 RepID=UPI0030146B72
MRVKKSVIATTGIAGALLMGLGAAAAPASAAPIQVQDGLVNVAIGDVTVLEDVNIGVAANIAANICGVKVGPLAVLGQAVDRSGETEFVCEAGGNTIELTQNAGQ